MAKIDVSLIEGYEEMSAEDKLKALEEFEMPEPDYSGYVRKEQFDKTASELAAKKKELRERLSAEEVAQQREQEEKEQRREEQEAILKELELLRRESEISKNKAKLIGLGYGEALAEETAEAMVDGDMEKVFANQRKHQEMLEKKVRAEALKNTPKPASDGMSKTLTLEDLRAMQPAERLKFSQERPEEYKQLYAGGN